MVKKAQKRPATKKRSSSKARAKKPRAASKKAATSRRTYAVGSPKRESPSGAPRAANGQADRTILFECIGGVTTTTPNPARMHRNETVVLVAVNENLTLTFGADGSPFKRVGNTIVIPKGESTIESVKPQAEQKRYPYDPDLENCTEPQGPPEMIVE
jgi:hypothetical protein